MRIATFEDASSITPEAEAYFDVIFTRDPKTGEKHGLDLPAYEPNSGKITEKLTSFAKSGGRHVLCHTLGQIFAAVEAGLSPIASMRLNCTSTVSAVELQRLGAVAVVLSPELNLAAIRDISRVATVGAVVYGRVPLMLNRRCILADSGCSGRCADSGCILAKSLVDRKGESFPVLPVGDKINVIYNSVPIYTADKPVTGATVHHYVFSVESVGDISRVIRAYDGGSSPEDAGLTKIKRIQK